VPILGSRPLIYLGRISYGMYLLHMLVLNAIRKQLGAWPLLTLLATVGGVTALAGISYRYFESPFITFSKRRLMVRKRGAKPVQAAQQPAEAFAASGANV